MQKNNHFYVDCGKSRKFRDYVINFLAEQYNDGISREYFSVLLTESYKKLSPKFIRRKGEKRNYYYYINLCWDLEKRKDTADENIELMKKYLPASQPKKLLNNQTNQNLN